MRYQQRRHIQPYPTAGGGIKAGGKEQALQTGDMIHMHMGDEQRHWQTCVSIPIRGQRLLPAIDHQQRLAITLQYRAGRAKTVGRSEEHTSELQSIMRISYAVFCLKKKNT